MTEEGLEEMEIKNLKKEEIKEKVISVRTKKSYTVWMKKNKINPSRLFNKAIEIIMKKEEEKLEAQKK